MNTTNEIEHQFLNHWMNNPILKGRKGVIAAVSGGPDSIAMLLLLNQLASSTSHHLVICHINHYLRPFESEKDEEFVAELASHLSLDFISTGIQLDHTSIQTTARNMRLNFFLEVGKSYFGTSFCIAMGHNYEDLVETFLHRCFSGTSLHGLSSIREFSPIDNAWIWHPVLYLKKKQLMQYCQDKGFGYRIDSSNEKNHYKRNALRNQLIPTIETVYPAMKKHIFQLSQHIAKEDAYLDSLVEKYFNQCCIYQDKDEIILNKTDFCHLDEVLQQRMILFILHIHFKLSTRLTYLNIKRIVKEIHIAGKKHQQIFNHPTWELHNNSDLLLFYNSNKIRSLSSPKEEILLEISLEQLLYSSRKQYFSLDPYDIRIEILTPPLKSVTEKALKQKNQLYFPAALLHNESLIIRKVKPGDRIQGITLNHSECGKKLKTLLINGKIPQFDRHNTLVLQNGHSIFAFVYQSYFNTEGTSISGAAKALKKKYYVLDKSQKVIKIHIKRTKK